MKTTKLIIFSIISVLLSSCYSAKQMNKAITKSVTEDVVRNVQVADTNIILNTEKLAQFIPSAKVTTIHNYFIPALFYWETRDLLMAEINNRTYINNFTDVLNRKAVENNFAEKLNGKKLEISIDNTPNEFYYDYKYVLIYFLFAYVYSTNWDIYHKMQHLKVSYRITKDNLQLKNGTFDSPFKKVDFHGFMWTESDAVRQYVQINKADFISASETLIQLIANEL